MAEVLGAGAVSFEEAVRLWESGAMVFFGEYRMSKGSHISWRDKESGKMLEADVLSHTIETAHESMPVNERLAQGVKPEAQIAANGLKKGDKVLVHVEQLVPQKGIVMARGRLQKVLPRKNS